MSYDADLKLFIDGSWRAGESRDVLPVVNPASGTSIAEVPLATEADLDEALAAADRNYPRWRATDVEGRAAILRRTAQLITERVDGIAALLTQEQGKPLAEARGEVLGAASMFEFYAGECKRAYGRVLSGLPVSVRSSFLSPSDRCWRSRHGTSLSTCLPRRWLPRLLPDAR